MHKQYFETYVEIHLHLDEYVSVFFCEIYRKCKQRTPRQREAETNFESSSTRQAISAESVVLTFPIPETTADKHRNVSIPPTHA